MLVDVRHSAGNPKCEHVGSAERRHTDVDEVRPSFAAHSLKAKLLLPILKICRLEECSEM